MENLNVFGIEIINGIYICPPPPSDLSYSAYEEIDYTSNESRSLFSKMFNSISKYKSELKRIAYSTPEFIQLIKSCVPEEIYVAIFTDDQKKKIADGALKFMKRKIDGSTMAVLVEPTSQKIVAQVSLEARKLTPELNKAISNFSMQLQLAEIAKSLEKIQTSVNNVIIDLRDERLALSDSNKEKYMQCIQFKNLVLKNNALLRIAMDSEDIRNRIMKDLSREISFIQNQPEDFFNKLIKGSSVKEIDSHINNIRVSVSSLNQLTCIEAMCYQTLDEEDAMLESLNYYSEYLTTTFSPKIMDRLHSFDGTNDGYWLNEFPTVVDKIRKLDTISNNLIEGGL